MGLQSFVPQVPELEQIPLRMFCPLWICHVQKDGFSRGLFTLPPQDILLYELIWISTFTLDFKVYQKYLKLQNYFTSQVYQTYLNLQNCFTSP